MPLLLSAIVVCDCSDGGMLPKEASLVRKDALIIWLVNLLAITNPFLLADPWRDLVTQRAIDPKKWCSDHCSISAGGVDLGNARKLLCGGDGPCHNPSPAQSKSSSFAPHGATDQQALYVALRWDWLTPFTPSCINFQMYIVEGKVLGWKDANAGMLTHTPTEGMRILLDKRDPLQCLSLEGTLGSTRL